MKKFMVFAISFVLLFLLISFLVELMIGIFLTFRHLPNINEAWNNSTYLTEDRVMFAVSGPASILLLVALFAAAISYLISQKIPNRNRRDS